MNERKNTKEFIKCNKCNGLMRRSLIDYKTTFKNEKIEIPNIEGYTCIECGNEVISESSNDFIEQQLKSKKLKILSGKNIVHLTVSSLKRVRTNAYLSQKELGDALGVSEQRYGAIERNTNTPIITMALILANILGVELQDLYQLVDIPSDLHETLLNSKIEETSFNIRYIKEVAETREIINKLRDDLEKYNNEKRVLRFLGNDKLSKQEITKLRADLEKYNNGNDVLRFLGNDKTSKQEITKRTKELNKKIDEIKKIKNGSSGLETHLKKLEIKHSIIIKQGSVIDIEDWEKIKIIFKEELN